MVFLAGAFIKNKSISSIIEDTGFDEKTVYKYFSFFRNFCFDYVQNNNIILGGPGVEVEIDETHLFTRKYHRGNVLASEHIWVFGIIERLSKKVYLEVVPKRDGPTLYNIVNTRVRRGTQIYSDSWAGYNLIRENYDTLSVNHRICFVDPVNRNIHTNNIERLWRTLKDDVRGACNDNYFLHLSEFMFRRWFFTEDFETSLEEFIKLIF